MPDLAHSTGRLASIRRYRITDHHRFRFPTNLDHNPLAEGRKSVIYEFIEERYTEELFLDFKRSSNNGRDKKLSQTDRQNMAKAISGFGNSEGGVLV